MPTREEFAGIRADINAQDLNRAKELGLVAPTPGDHGRYGPPDKPTSSFEVLEVKGMICVVRYPWNREDETSTFIWGFLSDGTHNAYHTWPGHPDWGDTPPL